MMHSLKSKIIFLIFITVTASVGVFFAIITTANIALYRAQVEKEIISIVKLNVAKVDRYTHSMAQKAADLARAGEIFYKMRKSAPNRNIDTEMKTYLVDNFSVFPEAIGGGIWYEPNTFYPDQKYYGPYAFRDKDKVVFTWDLNTPKYDYFNWDWYTIALPSGWDRTQKREQDYYWTPPYVDGAGASGRMITVDAFMYDTNGTIIGISTADWSIENMLIFLSDSKITKDSETFLVDEDSKIVIANTLDPNTAMQNVSTVKWISLLESPQKNEVKMTIVTIGGIEYYAYYTLTDAGMFYGTLVPSSVLSKEVNTLIPISVAGVILFILCLVAVLYFALSKITNSIIWLTGAVSRVAQGDLTTKIKVTSNDEIGLLSYGFNNMVEKLSTQRQELEVRTSLLEEKVNERTVEIEQKNKELTALKNNLETDLQRKYAELKVLKDSLEMKVTERTSELQTKIDEVEKINKFMLGRELKMASLKEQIAALEVKIAAKSTSQEA